MRFVIIRKADKKTEAGVLPDTEQITKMWHYTEELARAGVLLAADGLMASTGGSKGCC